MLEIFLQSKAKAEHLRLAETYVVVHQVIYAKAVEVLENLAHKDLKHFIVSQKVGFHITMTFLNAIGKKFKDASLKDLIIIIIIIIIITIIALFILDINNVRKIYK